MTSATYLWLLCVIAVLATGATKSAAAKVTVDVAAVGHRRNASLSTSYESFADQFSAYRLPVNSSTDARLLLFGEMETLTSAVIGSRGAAARQLLKTSPRNATLQAAMDLLAISYGEQLAYYISKFPESYPATWLMMALSDVMHRALLKTFSSIAKSTQSFVAVGAVGPRIRVSSDKADIAFFGDPDLSKEQQEVYLPLSNEIFNTAYVFEPVSGDVVFTATKVHLTPIEEELLHLTPGNLSDLGVFRVVNDGVASFCIAICFDAFWSDVTDRLKQQGCSVLLQPSANDGPWAAYVPGNNDLSASASSSVNLLWQPLVWTNSTIRNVQAEAAPLVQEGFSYLVNAMSTGNVYDLYFDGQSIITKRNATASGLLNANDTYVGLGRDFLNASWRAETLAIAPWAFPNSETNPGGRLSLSVWREQLEVFQARLDPISADATSPGQFLDSMITAQLTL